MPRRQAENTEKNNQKERRVMSQKERVDLIEVDLLDMCKYILSKWVFILIGMVVFAGAGFGYAKVKSVTEYSSKMQVYVTVPKTSDKVVIRDNVNELTTDYIKLLGTDLFTKGIADKTNLSKDELKNMIYAEAVDGTRVIEIKVKSENKNAVKKVSKLVIPSFQKMAVNVLGKDKPIIADYPSEIEPTETIETQKAACIGAVAGCVIVVGCYFMYYLIKLSQKCKNNRR